jgi:hypothetical protein
VDCLALRCRGEKTFAVAELASFYGRQSTVGEVLRRNAVFRRLRWTRGGRVAGDGANPKRAGPDRGEWRCVGRRQGSSAHTDAADSCVDGAPLNSEEIGTDINWADSVFCMTANTWGWSVGDTAARLMEEITKVQASGRPMLTSPSAMRRSQWNTAGDNHGSTAMLDR